MVSLMYIVDERILHNWFAVIKHAFTKYLYFRNFWYMHLGAVINFNTGIDCTAYEHELKLARSDSQL